jgi:predicted  nucleic acid-binding Zn-ribbon protein
VSQTAALSHLQTLDSQLDTVRKRLAEIEELLNQNAAVRAAQTALADAETSLSDWRTKQTELERDRDKFKQEAKSAEERLYSGQVFNPREMTDLQDKITELTHRQESLEEPTLEAMLAIEEGGETVKTRQTELEQVLAEQARSFGALGSEQTELTTRRTSLEADVASAREAVQAPHLATYDRLRKKSGVAVARIEGAGCGVCGVELNSQQIQRIRHDEIIPCPTCGRILVI